MVAGSRSTKTLNYRMKIRNKGTIPGIGDLLLLKGAPACIRPINALAGMYAGLIREEIIMILIDGVTAEGKKFRPSDWAEMLIESAGLAQFGSDHKIHYADDAQPGTIQGHAAIELGDDVERKHPLAYQKIMNFAKSNGLVVKHLPGESLG